jgi:hypothetical protein
MGKTHKFNSKNGLHCNDQTYTAMAKTVGLPVARHCKILNGKITTPGVHCSIRKEVYFAYLKELEEYGML